MLKCEKEKLPVTCLFPVLSHMLYTWFPPNTLHCIKLLKNILKKWEWLLLPVIFVRNCGLSWGVRRKNEGILPFMVQNKLLKADSSRTKFCMNFYTKFQSAFYSCKKHFNTLSRLQGSFTLCVWLDSGWMTAMAKNTTRFQKTRTQNLRIHKLN